jgi:L-2-amino-thiazoline-4-carboxylic acid hydrolase
MKALKQSTPSSIDIPIIEQVKIQARVLVPLVKALQAELGEERANAIVRKSLGDMYRKLGERWWQAQRSSNLGDNMASAFDMYAAKDALDYEVLKQAPDAFEMNVTGCRYAQFYKELGAPELGFLLVCSSDFPMAEGFGRDIELTRTQTIMQGASHCDFRYTRMKPKGV